MLCILVPKLSNRKRSFFFFFKGRAASINMEMIRTLSRFLPGILARGRCRQKLVRTLWMMTWGRGPDEILPNVQSIWFLPESRLRKNRTRVQGPAREARGPPTSSAATSAASRLVSVHGNRRALPHGDSVRDATRDGEILASVPAGLNRSMSSLSTTTLREEAFS